MLWWKLRLFLHRNRSPVLEEKPRRKMQSHPESQGTDTLFIVVIHDHYWILEETFFLMVTIITETLKEAATTDQARNPPSVRVAEYAEKVGKIDFP